MDRVGFVEAIHKKPTVGGENALSAFQKEGCGIKERSHKKQRKSSYVDSVGIKKKLTGDNDTING